MADKLLAALIEKPYFCNPINTNCFSVSYDIVVPDSLMRVLLAIYV